MRGLSSAGVLHAWETGAGLHPLDRALSVLAAGHPEVDRAALATLTVGQRDGMLIALRRGTFGDALNGFAECVACGERLEFTLSARDFPPAAEVSEGEVEIDGARVRFRLPTSLDLVAAAREGSLEAARRRILERCAGLDAASAGEATARAIAEAMAAIDAAADVSLRLECPTCGHAWEVVLDVESFFWSEISARARRLLGEVHTLASAYGWAEADILGMSHARRQVYLDMVGG